MSTLLQDLLAAPQAFAHPINDAQCIETHISCLLLVGEHVYKFKKPLALDFLDFSTLALRRAACEQELRLNRRTAPGIYLGLVAVVRTEEGLRVLPAEQVANQVAEDAVCEYAVHMRRFAQGDVLDRCLEQGRLLPEHLDLLAQHLAGFQAVAERAGAQDAWGTTEAVRGPVDQCLQALQVHSSTLPDAALQALQDVALWCSRQAADLVPVWEQRKAGGWIREGHGDLHLGNLVLLDGAPELFDALEFNPAFRWIDTVADMAFLFMDLQARARPDLAWRFLNAWLEHTGDFEGLLVLPYYSVYRALVRARVALLRRDQLGGDERDAAAREVLRYLALAQQFVLPRAVALWLTQGVSGSGKSRHSRVLAQQYGLVRVRSDVERKRLFGVPALAKSQEYVAEGIYTAQASEALQARLAQAVHYAVRAGYPVLVDSTLQRAEARHALVHLAQQLQVPCRILAFDAPESILRERVLRRSQKGRDASEADLTVLQRQLAARVPLSPEHEALAVHIDTSQPVDWQALLPAPWLTGEARPA